MIEEVLNARNDWEVLGLQSGVTPAQIKSAYRLKAIALHPDKNRDPRADEAFRRLTQSHEALTTQRDAGDQRLRYPARPAPSMSPPSTRDEVLSGGSSALLGAQVELHELKEELKELKEENRVLRQRERELAPGRDNELKESKRVATDARTSVESVKTLWAEKLATAMHSHEVERRDDLERIQRYVKTIADDAQRIRSLEAEVVALKAEVISQVATPTYEALVEKPRDSKKQLGSKTVNAETLPEFLHRLRLSSWAATLMAEEIEDVALLRSMGDEMLQKNMEEIGMCKADAFRIADDLCG